MKLGVIETGDVAEALRDKHQDYTVMFSQLMHSIDPSLEIFGVRTYSGEIPKQANDADGWIISGSRHGVYEDLPWIDPLKSFIRDCVSESVPIVGVCFGHQLLAEALGGKVEKSSKGWGLGVSEYSNHTAPSWMETLQDGYIGQAVHQDQIVTQPPNSTVVATSDFCTYAALVYGDQNKPKAISVQSHPEFSAEYVKDLIDVRLGETVGEEISNKARASLKNAVDNQKWAKTMYDFFKLANS